MNNKSLVIEAKAADVIVETKDGLTRVQIHNNIKLGIEMDGDVMLKSGGDFVIAANGEIDLISNGKPICIDSINSNLFFNSREAKPIKDLPESIEYKQKMIEENKANVQIATMQEMQTQTLKQRVSELEKQLQLVQHKIKVFEEF